MAHAPLGRLTLLALCALAASGGRAGAQAPELTVQAGHAADLGSLGLSHDERTLLTVDEGGILKVWDPTRRRLLYERRLTLAGRFLSVGHRVLFSADDRFVVLLGSEGLLVLDGERCEPIAESTAEPDVLQAMAFAPGDPTLYTLERTAGTTTLVLRKRLLPDLTPLDVAPLSFPVAGEYPQVQLDVDAEGERLLVLVRQGEHDAVQGRILSARDGSERLVLPAGLEAARFTPEGRLFALREVDFGTSELNLADATTGRVLRSVELETGYTSARFDSCMHVAWQTGGKLGAEKLGVLGVSDGVFLFDRTTLEAVAQMECPTPIFGALAPAFSRDGRWLVVGGQRLPAFFDVAARAPLAPIADWPPEVIEVEYCAATRTLALTSHDVSPALWRLDDDAPRRVALPFADPPPRAQLAVSPAGTLLATFDRKGSVTLGDLGGSLAREIALPGDDGKEKRLYFAPDGKHLAVACGTQAHVLDAAAGTLAFSLRSEECNYVEQGPLVAFSEDGERLAWVRQSSSSLVCSATSSGKPLWEREACRAVYRELEGDFLCLMGSSDVVRLDSRTGEERASASFLFEVGGGWNRTALAPDGKTLLLGEDLGAEGVAVFDLETEKLLGRLDAGDALLLSATFLDARHALLVGLDGALRLFDVRTCTQLARLVTFTHGDDWVVVAPDGRFDASEGGLAKVQFTRERTLIPLESLYEQFFTPHLLQQLLAGGEVEPAPVDIGHLDDPPTVALRVVPREGSEPMSPDAAGRITTTRSSIRLALEARSAGGTVDEIRLYRDGKLLESAARNLTVEEDVPAGDVRTKTFDVALAPGENPFRAVALNAERTESLPAELVVVFRPGSAAPETNPASVLYLVVVGIDHYKNPRYDLNYAVADAEGFRTALVEHARGIFARIDEHVLRNGEALKAGIVAALEEVAAAASPSDVLLFYYAGHGVLSEGAAKDYFLVPHDVTQLYGDDEGLAQRGLATRELQELSRRIPAQKQLFVLDACQAAGALETVAARGVAEEKAIAQLARSTGTHWLAASGSSQFASEFAELGHGCFTYALLQALGGAADSGDQRVTVDEVKAYLEVHVPELTREHRGAPQYPSSYGFGHDFPLGVVSR